MGDDLRRHRAVKDGACDHEAGICWGKPLPTPEQVEAMKAQRHVDAGCAHALGICNDSWQARRSPEVGDERV